MSAITEKLEGTLLKLSIEDRAQLAAFLIESLSAAKDEDGAADRLWLEEAKRRVTEHEADETTAIPAEHVFRQARSLLK